MSYFLPLKFFCGYPAQKCAPDLSFMMAGSMLLPFQWMSGLLWIKMVHKCQPLVLCVRESCLYAWTCAASINYILELFYEMGKNCLGIYGMLSPN